MIPFTLSNQIKAEKKLCWDTGIKQLHQNIKTDQLEVSLFLSVQSPKIFPNVHEMICNAVSLFCFSRGMDNSVDILCPR